MANFIQFFHIRRDLIFLKLSYFSLYASIHCILPFLPSIFTAYGLTKKEIAVLYGTLPCATLFVRPFTGYFADKFRLHNFITTVGIFIVVVFYGFLWAIPQYIHPHEVSEMKNFTQLSMNSSDNCSNINVSSVIDCDTHIYESVLTLKDNDKLFGSLFFVILSLYGLTFATTVSSVSIFNAMGFCIAHDFKGTWAHERRFGTIGSIVGTLLSGPLIDVVTGDDDETNYMPCFILVFVSCFAYILSNSLFLKVPVLPKNANLAKDFYQTLKRPIFLIFYIVIYFSGTLFGIMMNYIPLYFKTHRGMYASFVSVWFASGSLIELLILTISPYIHKRYGCNMCITVALLFYSLMYLAIGFIDNDYGLAATGVLTGVTLGLLWPAVTVESLTITPPGTAATMTAFCSSIHYSLGRGTGGLLGGLLYDSFGPQILFISMAVFAFCISVAHFIARKTYFCLNPEEFENISEKSEIRDETNNDDELIMKESQRLKESTSHLGEKSESLTDFDKGTLGVTLSEIRTKRKHFRHSDDSLLREQLLDSRDVPARQLQINFVSDECFVESLEYEFCPSRLSRRASHFN